MVVPVGIEPTLSAFIDGVFPLTKAPEGGWLLYPAYPQHFFSLWGLVHICIPHTGTPCGRVIGRRSYGLSWVTPFGIALPSPDGLGVSLLPVALVGIQARGFSYAMEKRLEVLCLMKA